jgi:hypothetical protein
MWPILQHPDRGPLEPKFLTPVRVEFLRGAGSEHGRLVRVLEDIRFVDSFGEEWLTPRGNVADGATIPFWLWPIIGGPYEGEHRDGALIHDGGYACALETTFGAAIMSTRRAATDRAFFEAMTVCGTPHWKRDLIYRGVRDGGWYAWMQDAKANQKEK